MELNNDFLVEMSGQIEDLVLKYTTEALDKGIDYLSITIAARASTDVGLKLGMASQTLKTS